MSAGYRETLCWETHRVLFRLLLHTHKQHGLTQSGLNCHCTAESINNFCYLATKCYVCVCSHCGVKLFITYLHFLLFYAVNSLRRGRLFGLLYAWYCYIKFMDTCWCVWLFLLFCPPPPPYISDSRFNFINTFLYNSITVCKLQNDQLVINCHHEGGFAVALDCLAVPNKLTTAYL